MFPFPLSSTSLARPESLKLTLNSALCKENGPNFTGTSQSGLLFSSKWNTLPKDWKPEQKYRCDNKEEKGGVTKRGWATARNEGPERVSAVQITPPTVLL